MGNSQFRSSNYRFTAKTLFGMEQILADELKRLGARSIKIQNRSVQFEGDKKLLYRANLECRFATRILQPFKSFRVTNEVQLYDQIAYIDWSKYLDNDKTLMIDSVVNYSNFTNSHYVSQKVKDAIVDQFRSRSGRRPSVDLTDPDLRINVHIHEDRATVSLDSSGEPLQKRGYRTEGGIAPLNEILAAGIIRLSRWDMNSAFVDMMCGSGTFVIEAALMAKNIAPGLTRKSFAFFKWKNFDQELWDGVVDDAKRAINDKKDFQVFGSDISPRSISEAGGNAKRAGVKDCVKFSKADFAEHDPPPGPGTLIINPPYGARLKVDEIEELYSRIGDCLKQKYAGYNAFVFTGNAQGAKRIGLRTSQKITLFNGPLECRLLKYELYEGTRK